MLSSRQTKGITSPEQSDHAFFTSLALERGRKAIAVVLSGGDGDGSLGLKAIKAAGGVTFAQCEDTAKFDSLERGVSTSESSLS